MDSSEKSLGFIPYGRQHVSPEDVASVVETLTSEWLTQGPVIERFERAMAEYCGAKYAVATSSATAALHLACMAVGLGAGDRLWTSPNTFVASANCGRYCGAEVDFVDIDPRTYNLDPVELEAKLEQASHRGILPKVLIPVHFAGQSCRMEEIAELARKYDVRIIEDASHAVGSRYRSLQVGSCAYSDMTIFSFHPVKIMTTGEGGMILTNNESHYHRLLRLRTHGITRAEHEMQGQTHGPWYYQQLELGHNYRMTDIQAALGLSQLRLLDEFVARRRVLARRYDEALCGLPIVLPQQDSLSESAFHLYVIRVQKERAGKGRKQVFEALRAAGIGVNVHYIPVHTQPYYQALGHAWGDFPQAETYYQEALTLPLYYDLSFEEQDRVISVLASVLT